MERRVYYKSEGNLTTIDFTPDVTEPVYSADVIDICANIQLAAQLCFPDNSNRKVIRGMIQKIRNQVDQVKLDTGQVPQFELMTLWGVNLDVTLDGQPIEHDPRDCRITEPIAMSHERAIFYNRINRRQFEISGHRFGVGVAQSRPSPQS